MRINLKAPIERRKAYRELLEHAIRHDEELSKRKGVPPRSDWGSFRSLRTELEDDHNRSVFASAILEKATKIGENKVFRS